MSELLKRFCPLEIAKNLGSEAVWLFNTAQQVKASVSGITFEPEADDWPQANIIYYPEPQPVEEPARRLAG